MTNWQEELLNELPLERCSQGLFKRIESAAYELGFEYCAYGLRAPLPLSNPKIAMLNNYPEAWQLRYKEMNYLGSDPSVMHCRRSYSPAVWSDEMFADTPQLWSEARSAGLRVGWLQSSIDANGVSGMLTLVRSTGVLSKAELSAIELKLRWLVQIAHQSIARLLMPKLCTQDEPCLTNREIEVLRWTADGKTTSQISDILLVSENTVNFHVKNAVLKLQTANKTSAAVRAALLGLLR